MASVSIVTDPKGNVVGKGASLEPQMVLMQALRSPQSEYQAMKEAIDSCLPTALRAKRYPPKLFNELWDHMIRQGYRLVTTGIEI